MPTGTEFCLLGPMVVRQGEALIPVPGGKPRAVLAALLLSPSQAVSLGDLTETLWGSEPPSTARGTIRSHVMRLRKALGADGARITTRPPGYRIRVDASELDVSRFERGLSVARTAAENGSWASAAREARQALALWRGEPLADVDSELLAMREVPRLAELRLQALETRINADLHLGRPAEVITELQQLASVHPLREQLHADLMLALYQAGRQAEALAAYQHARKVLVDEIGSEPGTGLREMHRRILAADPALTMEDAAPATAGTALATASPAPAVPRELPAAVQHFTGRAGELAALTGRLTKAAGERPRTVIISVISGTAGVGKTALAVHWAHQIAGRFPHRQLYVNLRGYDPDQPMPAADALAGFLHSLGVPDQDVPAAVRERAARYRSLLAGRQVLLVLDNAGSVEQVRPLLPGDPACAVVVTSRDSLAGLIARDGAERLDLGPLPPADAVDLLNRLIGERAGDDRSAASRLAGQCCRLPLTLRLAAELAISRPAVPLGELTEELADQQKRLDLLDLDGDPRTAVRAVFSWSCHHLAPATGRAFRLAGLHPGPDFDDYAVAALTGATLGEAQRLLGHLVRAHLIQPTRPGQYDMHDLLRAYACELAATVDGEDECRAALTRLLGYCLHTAAAAMDTLYPAESARRPRLRHTAVTAPAVDDPVAAQRWLDGERARLVAMAACTRGHGWPGCTIDLAAILYRYLHTGGHCDEAVTVFTHALRAARDTGDQAAETSALCRLGAVDIRRDMFPEAAQSYQQALALCGETGNPIDKAHALYGLGIVQFAQGRYEPAVGYFQQALTAFQKAHYPAGEALALAALGDVRRRQGNYRQAIGYLTQVLPLSRDMGHRTSEAYALAVLGLAELRQGHDRQASGHCQQAHTLCSEVGDRGGQAMALNGLGAIALRRGRYQQAIGHFRRAQDLYHQIGDRAGQAVAFTGLGAIALQQGDYQQASSHFGQALTLYRRTGVRSGQAEVLNGQGDVLLATGQPDQARRQFSASLDMAGQIGERDQQGRAHDGLGRAAHATGDLARARQH